jgi:hypothetical protein
VLVGSSDFLLVTTADQWFDRQIRLGARSSF